MSLIRRARGCCEAMGAPYLREFQKTHAYGMHISRKFECHSLFHYVSRTGLVAILAALCILSAGGFRCTAGPFDLALMSVNPQNFPYIYIDVSANHDALPESAFEVREDGIRQTDQFQIVPPEQGGGVKVVDIVFMMDNSYSMVDEQAAVAANVNTFVTELENQGFDYALGLCRFGASANSGYPILEDSGALTQDSAYFRDNLWARNDTSGGFEPGWDAICDSSGGFNFRPGALKVLILITDEWVDGAWNVGDHTKQEAIDALAANGIILFALIDQDATSIDAYGTIAVDSGGAHYNVQAQMDDILQQISDAVGSTYRISYKTSNPALNGIERTVFIEVNSGGQTDTCTGTYIPGAAPTIVRTLATVNLETQPWAAGTEFIIQADVEDTVPPGVQAVTLYYRTTGTIAYTPISMAPGSTRYTGAIAGADVDQPGVEYYISATDGQSTVTSPSVSAATNPHQIAVFPNVRPLITHTPVTTYTQGTAIDIAVDVVDQTTTVDSVSLFFRSVGQLVYQEVALQPSTGNSYAGQIPQAATTGQDLEYYIKATDDHGVSSYSCLDPDKPHVIIVTGGGQGDPVTEVIIGLVRFQCPTGFTVNGAVYSAQGEVNVSDLLYFIGSIELNKTTAMVSATGRVELRANLSLIGTLVIFEEATYEFDASDFEFLWTGNLTSGFDLSDILPGIGSIDALFVNYEFVSLTIEAHLQIPLAKDPNEVIRLDIDQIVITKDGITDIEVGFQSPNVLGFTLNELDIEYHATNSGYQLDIYAEFQFPRPYSVGVEIKFGLLNGKLNTLIIVGTNLNILMYAGPPGIWLEKLGGGVENLQISEQTGWYFTAGLSFAPVAPGPKVVFVDGEINLDAVGTFTATVGIRLFDADNEPFADGRLVIGSSGGYVKGKMTITVLRLDGTIAVGSNGAFGGYLTGTVAIQKEWKLIGLYCCGFADTCTVFGVKYPCNWQCKDEVEVPVASVVFLAAPEEHSKIGLEVNLGPVGTHGLTYTEDPSYTEGVAFGNLHIGTNIQKLRDEVDQIVPSASRLGPRAQSMAFQIVAETPFLLITASWQYGDMDLALVLPDGQTVNAAQMILEPSTYQYRKGFIEGEWRALIVVNNPPEGEWSVNPDNLSGVETYNLTVYGADPVPSVAITGIRHVGATVEIDWETQNADGAELWLFRTPSCGTLAGAAAITYDPITVVGDSGTYSWDTTGSPTGEYYVAVIVDDGRNAPRTECSGEVVSIMNPDQLPAPTDLQATRVGTDTVDLQWDYAGPAGLTKGFIVYYTNEPHSTVFTGQLVVFDAQSCTLDGLPSSDRYCFAVAAFDDENDVGVLSELAYLGGGDVWSNRSPVFTSSAPEACQAGAPLLYLARASDPDGDLVTYLLRQGPSDAALDSASGLLLWTPDQDDVGSASFEIVAEDGFGDSATQAFTLDVTVEPVTGGATALPIPELEDTVVVTVGEEVFLNGCEEGTSRQALVDYQWEVVVAPSSGSFELLSATSCSAVFRALVPGEFRLRLTLASSDGVSSTVEMAITADVVDFPGDIICAPNPVRSEGVAFYYHLPVNAKSASVRVYDLLGRWVSELSLEVDDERYPLVGSWNPQTFDGEELSNGAYVYMLVVDGRIMDWKKLVIYR